MSHAPSPALSLRHQTLRRELVSRGLDALVVTSLPNILYLTNFTGSSAIVVLTRRSSALHHRLPLRHRARRSARHRQTSVPTSRSRRSRARTTRRWRTCSARQPWRRIGFEAAHLTVDRYRWLKATLAANGPGEAELVATEGLVERARVRKDRVRDRRAPRGGAAAVGGRRGGATRGRPRPDRAGRGAGHRPADAPGRFRAPGVRYHRRERTERRAAARAPGRANINRRRPGGAGLRRRLRLILRRPDPDGVGRHGQSRGPARCYAAVREAHDRAIAAVGAGRVAVRHRRRGAGRARRGTGWARHSGTAPGTASASRCTRSRGSRGGGRTSTPSDEAVDAGHGLHDRAGRLSARVGRRPHRGRCAGDGRRASRC